MKIIFLVLFTIIFPATVHAESLLKNESQNVVSYSPKAISRPAARYPKNLLKQCVGGTVTFKFTVMQDGKIHDVEIIDSPHEQLSQAVVDTVRKSWLFTPYIINDSEKLATLKSHMSFYPEC